MNGKSDAKVALPPIPAKRYFTIGEVSELCGVKPHVLRYWEQEFSQLRPMKRRGNRRYYQHHEVLLVRRIRELLYEEGFTINGARNRLGEAGGSRARSAGEADDATPEATASDVRADASAQSEPAEPALVADAADEVSPRDTSLQPSLPFALDPFDGHRSVREALQQALDLLR
jgi:DNA-binding transcriptional MerR regulator